MHRDLDYETKIIKSFNINTMFHICHSSVPTVYCVLKSVWRYVHLVCIGIDLKMCCSASQVIKATSLVCDLPQFCTRSRILLYDHLTCLQNFFFSNAIFAISQNQIYHVKFMDFPGTEHSKEHTMNPVGTCHQEFHRMLCTSVASLD